MNETWLELLDRENVQLVILDRNDDAELLEAICCQPNWALDCEDEGAVIFTRSGVKDGCCKRKSGAVPSTVKHIGRIWIR